MTSIVFFHGGLPIYVFGMFDTYEAATLWLENTKVVDMVIGTFTPQVNNPSGRTLRYDSYLFVNAENPQKKLPDATREPGNGRKRNP